MNREEREWAIREREGKRRDGSRRMPSDVQVAADVEARRGGGTAEDEDMMS